MAVVMVEQYRVRIRELPIQRYRYESRRSAR